MDAEIHLHDPSAFSPSKPHLLVFFISGNPGVIEYYRIFLTHLYGLLSSASTPSGSSENISSPFRDYNIHVYGRNLAGFGTNGCRNNFDDDEDVRRRLPLSLKEQVEYVEDAIDDIVERILKSNDARQKAGAAVQVIPMGHSVGGYIAMEVLRRRKEWIMQLGNTETNGFNRISWQICTGVLLTPSVTKLADSESGKRVYSWVIRPTFAARISQIAKAITTFIPSRLLISLIGFVTGFPQSGVETTVAFLKSPMGVQQALHMARDELLEITTDRWNDDIWGSSGGGGSASISPLPQNNPHVPLYFLFAAHDHWIDACRDALIPLRAYNPERDGERLTGPGKRKPFMEVDGEIGFPHAFSLAYSVPVAKKVAGYIEDGLRRLEIPR
ncbi:MAG: hypothetical protein M1820_009221 [Bogoriella megaspora]|nr:MAG: hypothetical protein M1820_009221 [Bogoriella megaspora]